MKSFIRKFSLGITFILLLSSISSAQYNPKDYNQYIALAQSETDINSRILYYEKAFSYIEKPFLDHHLSLTRDYARAGQQGKLIESYMHLLKYGYSYESVFSSFYKIDISEDLADSLKEIKRPALSLDIEFIAEFSGYYGQEQFIRKRNLRDTCLKKYMGEVDSLNHLRLKNYIDKNGFPHEFKIGRYKYVPFFMLLHIISNESTHKAWLDYYRPILISLAEEGKFYYPLIARLDDRHHAIFHSYQLYGTLFSLEGFHPDMTDDEIKKLQYVLDVPVKDIENLDRRRKSLYMEPFYLESERFNIKLPEDYSPKK
jgi:hypothetical protein